MENIKKNEKQTNKILLWIFFSKMLVTPMQVKNRKYGYTIKINESKVFILKRKEINAFSHKSKKWYSVAPLISW